MKNKLFSILMAGLLVLPLAGLISGANKAFADDEHGKRVSEAARENQETRGEHGFRVSSIARQNNGYDDGGDENENDNNDNDNERDEHGLNATSTSTTSTPEIINNNSLQALERFVAFLQEQIQILINKLNQLKGGIAAPVISSVTTSNIASTSATVSWLTDKAASSKVYYSTSSPVNLATAFTAADVSPVTSHSINLSGLNASTTYFFIVESIDASSSVSRSAQFSFTTLNVVAPVISSVSVSGVSSSSATISWTTDILSTSKVYYSTSTPVNLATALTVSSSSLITSHSLGLTGLATSTNYFFIVESVNASNIASQSAQFSFLTMP